MPSKVGLGGISIRYDHSGLGQAANCSIDLIYVMRPSFEVGNLVDISGAGKTVSTCWQRLERLVSIHLFALGQCEQDQILQFRSIWGAVL